MGTISNTFEDTDSRNISPARTGAISVALIVHIAAFALLFAPVRRADFELTTTPPAIEVLMPERVRPIPPPPLAPIVRPTTPPARTNVTRAAPPPVMIENTEPAESLAQLVQPFEPTMPDIGEPVSDGLGEHFMPEQIGNASYLIAPPPKYPARELRRGSEGEVLLLVTIGANGLPESVTVQQSSGREALDRAALEQVQRRWRFRPLLVDGTPTRSRALVPIRFSLD